MGDVWSATARELSDRSTFLPPSDIGGVTGDNGVWWVVMSFVLFARVSLSAGGGAGEPSLLLSPPPPPPPVEPSLAASGASSVAAHECRSFKKCRGFEVFMISSITLVL